MITLEMTFEYSGAKEAEAVYASLSPENSGFVESRLGGNTVVFSVSGNDASTVRATADDLLACVKAAESSLGILSAPEYSEYE